MCNLYTVRKSRDEVAAHFSVKPSDIPLSNAPETVAPGSPGLVIRVENGVRVMQTMVWGFPLRLKFMAPDSKPKTGQQHRRSSKADVERSDEKAGMALPYPGHWLRRT